MSRVSETIPNKRQKLLVVESSRDADKELIEEDDDELEEDFDNDDDNDMEDPTSDLGNDTVLSHTTASETDLQQYPFIPYGTGLLPFQVNIPSSNVSNSTLTEQITVPYFLLPKLY